MGAKMTFFVKIEIKTVNRVMKLQYFRYICKHKKKRGIP
jgi:hypothetical protein